MSFFAEVGVAFTSYYAVKGAVRLFRFYRGHFTAHKIDFSKLQTAVITGPTDGIGKAYAFELARLGMKRLVLIGRNPEKLNLVSSQLLAQFPNLKEVRLIQADFESVDVYPKIESEMKDIHDVDVLVNNVGANINIQRNLHETSRRNLFKMVNINIVSTLMMSQLVIDKMVRDQRRGVVINMSSIAARLPPSGVVYGASKQFVTTLSEGIAIQYDNDKYGISVQCVEPALVRTKMGRFLEGPFSVSTDDCVRQSLRSVGKLQRTTGAVRHEVLDWLHSFVPRTMLMKYYRDHLQPKFSEAAKKEAETAAKKSVGMT